MHERERSIRVEIVSIGFFFNFKEFVLGLCYLDSFKFYLFSGLWETKGPDTDYFLILFPTYTEESGDVGRTIIPVPGPTVRLQLQEMLP